MIIPVSRCWIKLWSNWDKRFQDWSRNNHAHTQSTETSGRSSVPSLIHKFLIKLFHIQVMLLLRVAWEWAQHYMWWDSKVVTWKVTTMWPQAMENLKKGTNGSWTNAGSLKKSIKDLWFVFWRLSLRDVSCLEWRLKDDIFRDYTAQSQSTD